MELIATDDDMFIRMDRRDYYRKLLLACAGIGVVLMICLAVGYRMWTVYYWIGVSISGSLWFYVCYRKEDDSIVSMEDGSLKLTEDGLTIRQPRSSSQFLMAKICYCDITGIAEEEKVGRPRFYVRIKPEARDSRIMESGKEYLVGLVDSFGYEKQEFWKLYLEFRDRAAKMVPVPEVKILRDKKWKNPGIFTIWLLYPALYLVPVILFYIR
ncbi:MAG: hypothetical protein LBT06_07495 [Hungatella sp.]|jgi:hypothetical protein|nr:hypothetical protein [Hungatella sp.]